MKTSLRGIALLGTFLVGTAFLLGSAEKAHAPELSSRPAISRMNDLEARSTTSVRVAEARKIQEIFGKSFEAASKKAFKIYSERRQAYDSDPIYREVTQVYESVKDNFDLKEYFTPEFFRADISVESSDYQFAVSRAGAKGYTQMTSAAAEDVGVSDFDKVAFNPWDNMNISMAYFASIDRQLSKGYPGWDKLSDMEKLRNDAYAYNMGYGAFLSKCFGVDGKFTNTDFPQETKDYWPKILKAWAGEFPNTFAEYAEKHAAYSFDILKKYLPGPEDISASKGLIASK